MKSLWIVAFDTPCDLRRRSLVNALGEEGQRVQESVFECWLDGKAQHEIWRKLAAIADPEEDRILAVRNCTFCRAGVVTLGRGGPAAEAESP